MEQTIPRALRGKSGRVRTPDMRDPSLPRVAIVGSGPTAIYALKQLLTSPQPLEIHLFEREREIGTGMPYREGENLPQMLSNIGSREVPPVVETLEDFLRSCDAATFREFGISGDDIGPETFYPRLVLGRYFVAQLAALTAQGRGKGHAVEIRSRHAVTDVIPSTDGAVVTFETPHTAGRTSFEHVVLATGHQWSEKTDPSGVVLHAPWPAERLRRFLDCRVGILGSSLTAIDAAVALASFHGHFDETDGTRWIPNSKYSAFRMAMLSRRGLLPDADWFYPLPLPGLPTFNRAGLDLLVSRTSGKTGLLKACQRKLGEDLRLLDPTYATRAQPDRVEGYAERHFADRLKQGGWGAARTGLTTAAKAREARHTDPWRMALLAAHLTYESLLLHFSAEDRRQFDRELRPVFADVYASVPHRSIRRMLALNDAGVLELHGLGHNYTIAPAGHGVQVFGKCGVMEFDHLVDARGQTAASLADLSFPTLSQGGHFDPESLRVTHEMCCASTITCAAIPVLLRHNPFVQGLENVEELGRRAADNVLASIAPPKAA